MIDSLGIRPKTVVEEIKVIPQDPLWKVARTAGPFIQIAAFSGAAAMILGAYGSHSKISWIQEYISKFFLKQ